MSQECERVSSVMWWDVSLNRLVAMRRASLKNWWIFDGQNEFGDRFNCDCWHSQRSESINPCVTSNWLPWLNKWNLVHLWFISLFISSVSHGFACSSQWHTTCDSIFSQIKKKTIICRLWYIHYNLFRV